MRVPGVVILCLLSVSAHAEPASRTEEKKQKNGHLLLGLQGGALPYAMEHAVPMVGVDCGVLIPGNLGFGLQALVLPRAEMSTGLLANIRWYTEKVQPLTFYASLAVGLVGGALLSPGECVGASHDNRALCGPRPTVNPGVGAMWRGNNLYAAVEMSWLGLQAPFASVTLGLDFELLPTLEI